MIDKNKIREHIDDFQKATGLEGDIDPHVYRDVLTFRFFGKTVRLSRCIDCPEAPGSGCGKWSFSWQGHFCLDCILGK